MRTLTTLNIHLPLAIRQLGWINACLYWLGRLLARLTAGRWTLHKYLFLAQPLGQQALCPGRGRDIEVRLLERLNQLDQLPPGYPRPAAVLAERYAQGAQSLAALRNGELAGFLWFLPGAYQEDEVRARYLLPAANAVWDFDVYVRPQDRLGWTFRRLWDETRLLLRARAMRWSCSRISAFNGASLRAHAALGTVRLGTATFLRCGRWQWMCASLPPYLHLSRGPAAFPRLRLDTRHLPEPP